MPPIDIKEAKITLTGTSPLITHPFGEKVRAQILAKQSQQPSEGRAPKDPDEEIRLNFYVVPGRESGRLVLSKWPLREVEAEQGMFGFPASGFKGAAVSACRYLKGSGLTMNFVRGAFHVLGDILPLRWEKIRKRDDAVRLQRTGSADVRYRPEFVGWEIDLPIAFNSRGIGLAQIVNLYQHAGFSVGVGDWRPEKDGVFGMWRVKTG